MHVLKLDSDGLRFFFFGFVSCFAWVQLCHCTHTYQIQIKERENHSHNRLRITWPKQTTCGKTTFQTCQGLQYIFLHAPFHGHRWTQLLPFECTELRTDQRLSCHETTASACGSFLKKKTWNYVFNLTSKLCENSGPDPVPTEVKKNLFVDFSGLWIKPIN